MPEDWQEAGFGLYVHWPYCQAKCPYCDFNSHVAAEIDQESWAEAYVGEIDRIARATGPRLLNSIFFGGGTPSLMDPELVSTTINAAAQAWPFANDCEITLEANPTSSEAGRFRAYCDAGVNRLSLGVQALRDGDLRRLGRLHDSREALAAYEMARSIFDRVSFDLIYARQGQSLASWEAELGEALSLNPDHLSLYQLTIEPNTAFGALARRGKLSDLPNEDLAADMYEITQELCTNAGLPAYEISNHARPGEESRHNMIYWRYGDYAGIGPGAHGRLTLNRQKQATVAIAQPDHWLRAALKREAPEKPACPLSPEEQATEYLMIGLRLTEGISLSRFHKLSRGRISLSGLNRLQEQGLVSVRDDNLRATAKGRPLLNAILREIQSP